MNMLCIVNPIAGGGRVAEQVMSLLRTISRDTGLPCDIVTTKQRGDGTRLAKQAVQQGYGFVVAAGGDGTMNEVATGLVDSGVTFGLVPVGSGNGLARSLKIPLRYQDACQLLFTGVPRAIDVGQVAGRCFFATSGIGFDAFVGKKYNEATHHSRGLMPYVQIAVTEYKNYAPERVTLHCDGQHYHYTAFVLTVANTEQYGGGAIIAPGAMPDDGLFDVCIVPQTNLLTLTTQLPKLFTRQIDTFPNFRRHRTAALKIMREAAGPVHVDGEAFMAGAVLEYALKPRALRVVVPR